MEYQLTKSDEIYDVIRKVGVYIREDMDSYTEFIETVPLNIRKQISSIKPESMRLDEWAEEFDMDTSKLIEHLAQATPVGERVDQVGELRKKMLRHYGMDEDLKPPKKEEPATIENLGDFWKWLSWGPYGKLYRGRLYKHGIKLTLISFIAVLAVSMWMYSSLYQPIKPVYTVKEIEKGYCNLVGRHVTVKTPIVSADLWQPETMPWEKEASTQGIVFMNSYNWEPFGGKTTGFMLVSFQTQLWEDLRKLRGKMVTVSGQLQLYKFSPEIIINSMKQIKKVENYEGDVRTDVLHFLETH